MLDETKNRDQKDGNGTMIDSLISLLKSLLSILDIIGNRKQEHKGKRADYGDEYERVNTFVKEVVG